MTPKRRQRLVLVTLLVTGVGAAVALALTALNQNINLFYTPTQVAQGEAPENTGFRLGGMVVDSSVKRDTDSLQVRFDLTDHARTVTVYYDGILPDLFREGQGIVTTGSLQNGQFVASEVLAKHDETYMPPEVSDALQKASAAGYQPDTSQ